MRSTVGKLKKGHWSVLAILLVLAMSTSAFAQGSIYGTVTNSDLSTPANGEIAFVGFLDDTDEEIRIETSDGAGYDGGYWYDDFQNYLTEAPGNPYDYLFYNTTNGEGYRLSEVIPDNSFQEENVALAAVAWPAAPDGLTGVTVSGSTVILAWNYSPGLTYHVYRRVGTSNGSFFRLDNTAGEMTDPGVSDDFYVDASVDGVSAYDYLIIAEDASGNLSPHSTVVTVNTAGLDTPVLVSLDPTTGTASGGTTINIEGSGFDPAGVNVLWGTETVAATVISPYALTMVSPAGTVGASVDISLTNIASGLSSNILTGGFTYAANATPVLAAIGAQETTENISLGFTVTAMDADGDTPLLTSSTLPGTASFEDNGDGTGSFNWLPLFTDAGVYSVTFYATDAVVSSAVDSEVVQITVLEAGNQSPVMAPVNDTSIAEGGTLALVVSASDPDGEIPSLSASGYPTNASFTDNLDGTGNFDFSPDLTQAGVYDIVFKAMDAAMEVDSIVVQITVTEVNQAPELATIGSQSGIEGILLTFAVSATDADGTVPVLSTSELPEGASFTDSLNGAGAFEWIPSFTDFGTHQVTFYATDADVPADIDSEIVTIEIADAGNQAPVLNSIGAQAVAEGGSLNLTITASDPDGTIPTLLAVSVPTNATFEDQGDGTALFYFAPDYTQSGVYNVTFVADDGVLADTEIVAITVTELGNLAPVIDSVGDFAVDEGVSLQIPVTATDPDGGGIYPVLSVSTTLSHYTFTDNGDGTGLLTYDPDFYDAGIDTVSFFATDFGVPQQSTGMISVITTADVNQPPVIDPIGPFGAAVGELLEFTVTTSDPTAPDTTGRVFLSTLGLPANATFVDNGYGTGTFEFTPDVSQVGLVTVSFLAVDQGTPQQSTTLAVDINVVAENIPPVLDSIGPHIIVEGGTLVLDISASDPDGAVPPSILLVNTPEGGSFIDNGDGTAQFTFTPGFFGTTRLIWLEFRAYDGIAIDKEIVLIQIQDAGNQAPVFDELAEPIPPVMEGDSMGVEITAYDPDGSSVTLEADPATLPTNATFTDLGDGVGLIIFKPDYTQAGVYDIDIIAYDGPMEDEGTLSTVGTFEIEVEEAGNQYPQLAPISDQTVLESATLTFSVMATDPDGTAPELTAAPLPTNATMTDNGDGTGDFEFIPDYTQAGVYEIMFYASDGVETDSQMVTITVNDNNRLPFVFTSGGSTIYEGDTLAYGVTSFDADGTIPYLSAYLSGQETLAPNMTFDDNRDGTGTLTFMPDYTQGGPASNPLTYNVVFRATDEDYPDVWQTSATVTIAVINVNQEPELFFMSGSGPFSAMEGDSIIFGVVVVDPDVSSSMPTLTIQNLPDSNADFSSASGLGTFRFYPDYTQAGSYSITFVGTDEESASVSQIVEIEITEAGNQPPTLGQPSVDTAQVPVGGEYCIEVEPYDPDLDSISLEVFPIYPGATWTDRGDGTGEYVLRADSTYLDSVLAVTVVVTDHPSLVSDTAVTYLAVVPFLRGDLDNNSKYSINDVAYLIAFLFRDGPEPVIAETADVDGDGSVNIGDITFLIYYIYYLGPQPPR